MQYVIGNQMVSQNISLISRIDSSPSSSISRYLRYFCNSWRMAATEGKSSQLGIFKNISNSLFHNGLFHPLEINNGSLVLIFPNCSWLGLRSCICMVRLYHGKIPKVFSPRFFNVFVQYFMFNPRMISRFLGGDS